MIVIEKLEARRLLSVDVLDYHYGNARIGLNAAETVLAPANVKAGTFGKLYSQPVDGAVYAQPLVKTGVSIAGEGTHDVVFIATEHDSVYAFDANDAAGANAAPLWHKNFLSPKHGVTTVPAADILSDSLGTEVGITSTPVIDAATNTMYVVVMTKEVSSRGKVHYQQRLHALDIGSGAEKFGGPVIIAARVKGKGDGNDGTGHVSFNPLRNNQRPALTLVNGVVYIAWASFGDHGPYHGWVMGYSVATLQQTAVLNVTPNGGLGGIWQSGAGVSVDTAGNLFLTTGNGTFDADKGGRDFGDAIVRTTGALAVTDYFAPFNQADLEARDKDLGSGGVLLLPDSAGSLAHPHLAVFGGKEGRLYLVDRDNLGAFHSDADAIVQSLPGGIASAFDTPAFFNGTLYYAARGDRLKAFPVSGAHVGTASVSKEAFGSPGATPSISANGTTAGIVWLLTSGRNGHAVLMAYDATNVRSKLYTSDDSARRDQFGNYVKFTSPVIANGRVYAATQNGFAVFGLLT